MCKKFIVYLHSLEYLCQNYSGQSDNAFITTSPIRDIQGVERCIYKYMHRRRIKLFRFREQFYRQPRPKTTATEAEYSRAKTLRALALWGEWIGARELAHSKHIHSPHTTTVGCEALAHKPNAKQIAVSQ